MKIVNPSYEILDLSGYDQEPTIKKLAYAARVCYKSFDKSNKDADKRLIKHILTREHLSVIEHKPVIIRVPLEYGKEIKMNIGLISGDSFYGELDFFNMSIDGDYMFVSANFRTFKEYMERVNDTNMMYYFNFKFPYIFDEFGDTKSNHSIQFVIWKDLPTKEHKWVHGYITVRFIANRGFCYDDQTEVLTEDGWKYFKNTVETDKFFTLNMDTKETEYQQRTDTTIEDWDSDLIYGKSSMVDFAVTPNHRMLWYHYDSRNPTWKIDKAEEVYGRRVKFQRGLFQNWKKNSKIQWNDLRRFVQGGELSLPFARFMGIFITDGSKWKGKDGIGRITIYQIKKSGRNYIRNVLKDLGYHFSEDKKRFRITNIRLYNFLTQYFPAGEKRYETARVPKFIRFGSKKYISAFLEGVIVGDGNIHKSNKHKVIYTTNYKLAGDYQECILKSGKCSSIRTDNRVGQKRYNAKIGNIITNKRICYIVSITDRTNEHLFAKKHWSKKHYKGKVYCVTVPNGTLYVRRNGKAFWCNNTHEIVRHRLASFSQRSTRFCDESDGINCLVPSIKLGSGWWTAEQFRDIINKTSEPIDIHLQYRFEKWAFAMHCAETMYNQLRGQDWNPQTARGVLPIDLETEIVVTARFDEWDHIFKLRTSSKAHPIMQKLMRPLLDSVKEKYPIMFRHTPRGDWNAVGA